MLVSRFLKFFRHIDGQTLREVRDRILQQRLMGLSAEVAYHALLALFPALLAIIAAVGLFTTLQSALYAQARLLAQVAPDEVRILVRGIVHELTKDSSQRLLSLSFLGSLWAFSGAISAAMTALDQIHQIPLPKARPFWKARLMSLVLTIGTIGLLAIASFLSVVSDFIVQLVANQSCLLEGGTSCPIRSGLLALWRLWSLPITLGIVSAAFGFIYRFGPSYRLPGLPLMPGAILAAISWALLSGLFKLYVSHFGNYNRVYGTIGAFIVLQLWLYLGSLVMLVGDQLNVTVGQVMRRDRDDH